jgi:serine/threonine protein kinase
LINVSSGLYLISNNKRQQSKKTLMATRIRPTFSIAPKRWTGPRPLNDRYRKFRHYWRGSQGDLFIGQDFLNGGALVAIKFLAQDLRLFTHTQRHIKDKKKVYDWLCWLFTEEVKIHSRLVHAGVPNIPTVVEDIGQDLEIPVWDGSEIKLKDNKTFSPGKVPYFAVACIDGVNLRYLIRQIKKGDLDIETSRWGVEVAGIMLGLLDALAGIHNQGYIHRQVEPETIIFDSEGRPFLTDFAISALGKSPLSVKGLDNYLAPERLTGKGIPISDKFDIYSIGYMGLELLSSAEPHLPIHHPNGFNIQDTLTHPLLIFNSRPGLTALMHPPNRDLASIFLKLTSIDPDQRPTAQEAKRVILELYPSLSQDLKPGVWAKQLKLDGQIIVPPITNVPPNTRLVDEIAFNFPQLSTAA